MSTSRMNDATLRRLQDRVEQEDRIRELGHKDNDDEANNNMDDPATADDACTHKHTLYTAPTAPTSGMGSEYERHVRQQAEIMQSFQHRDVDVLASQFQQRATLGDSPISSLGEEFWACVCGVDCPMVHHFCGNCGSPRPENWWCECGAENSPYHRFCVECGREETFLDDDLLDEQAADIPQTVQDWDDVDDELTFANESCDVDTSAVSSRAKLPQQNSLMPEPPRGRRKQDDAAGAWSCETCTYLNENPLFMCCELCGSARPASPGNDVESIAKKAAVCDASSSSVSTDKKKEKSVNDMIREQQKQFYEQQQQSSHPRSVAEPETDHELAMIYAQQERLLAQYQQQQQQRAHR